ncbi:MAG: hypothetical protein ASARMPRED_005584 [Alectoria sarmentosa]|nr:MAG: hypothetical protein ASARMPRED_005584 [Alectoria sarmentosa]
MCNNVDVQPDQHSEKGGRQTHLLRRAGNRERVTQVDEQSILASSNNNDDNVFLSKMRDETASTSFPSQADVEREENVTPRSRGVEAGDVAIEMDDLHKLLANEPKNISPDAAIAGDLQIWNTVSGEITKRRLLSTDTRGGPRHLKLRKMKSSASSDSDPSPRVSTFAKGTCLMV